MIFKNLNYLWGIGPFAVGIAIFITILIALLLDLLYYIS